MSTFWWDLMVCILGVALMLYDIVCFYYRMQARMAGAW